MAMDKRLLVGWALLIISILHVVTLFRISAVDNVVVGHVDG
jgi:hypothetical protein